METLLPILIAISFSHLPNDTTQSLIQAIYPLFKNRFSSRLLKLG